MPDLWKEMMLGTVAGEEAKGISICCELLGGKGTDRIFVSLPSWRGGNALQSVRSPSEQADSFPMLSLLFRKLWRTADSNFLSVAPSSFSSLEGQLGFRSVLKRAGGRHMNDVIDR